MPKMRGSAVLRVNAVDWLRSGDQSCTDKGNELDSCTCGSTVCNKHLELPQASRESLLTHEGTQNLEFVHISGILQTFLGAVDGGATAVEPVPGKPETSAGTTAAEPQLSISDVEAPVPALSLEGPPAMASTCSCPLVFPGGPPSGNCPHMPQACSSLDPNDPTLFVGPSTDFFRQPYTSEQRWRFLASHTRQNGGRGMYAADRQRRNSMPTLHSPEGSFTHERKGDAPPAGERVRIIMRDSMDSSRSERITSSGGDIQCGKCFACRQGAALLGSDDYGKAQSLCLRSVSTRPSRSAAEQSTTQFPQKITVEDNNKHVVDKIRIAFGRMIRGVLCKGPAPTA